MRRRCLDSLEELRSVSNYGTGGLVASRDTTDPHLADARKNGSVEYKRKSDSGGNLGV